MCDEKERAKNGEGRVGTGDPGMFDQCAPMMRSVFGKVGSILEEAREGFPGQAAGATESAGSCGTAPSTLELRERELVALGAAMGSNCVPCIEYHVPKAREAGLTDAQIREAIRLADKVRKVPARKVLDAGLQLLSDDAADAPADVSADVSADVETPPRSRGATPPSAGGACCG